MSLRGIRGCSAVALFVLAACRAPQRASRLPAEARRDPRANEQNDAESIVVRAELGGSARVRYSPELLGARGPVVRVSVENRGGTTVDVSNLRVRLEASRDGVSFPCAAEVGPEPGAREKAQVPLGASATFERRLDCGLPLVGEYLVKIVVAFGEKAPWREGRSVHTLRLRVVSPTDTQPRPLGSPGLWAAVGASAVVGASPRAAPSKVAVAIVNGGASPITTPPLRIGLRVYRRGVSIPCEDEPRPLELPPTLLAGRSYVQLIEVSCLGLGTPGHYEIAPRILVPKGSSEADAIELGRVRVEVSSDPVIFNRANLGP